MKYVFLLLFIVGLSFSFSSSVFDENLNQEEYFQNLFIENQSQNASFLIDFQNNPISLDSKVFFGFIGLTSQIDNYTIYHPELSVVFATGGNFDPLLSLGSSADSCNEQNALDFARNGQGWRCDFDHDNCVEYVSQNLIIPNLSYTFSYSNVSIVVFSNQTYTKVPPRILSLMQNSSISSPLNISINGSVDVVRRINDRTFGIDSCVDRFYDYSKKFNYSFNGSFYVLGSRVHFFQIRPVLAEQLSQNSKFDFLIFSSSPLSNLTYYLNDNVEKAQNISFVSFSFDRYGLLRGKINFNESNPTHQSSFETYLIEVGNISYNYLFFSNFSYFSPSKNNLSIQVFDLFGNPYSYNSSILSRSLKNGNMTQFALPPDSIFVRPSFEPDSLSLNQFSIFLPVFGFLIILYLLFKFSVR
jgi:hypothetical protein